MMKYNQFKPQKTDRRTFLKKSSFLVAAGTLAYHQPSFAAWQVKESVLKVGLIGCGGRGTGAAAQALQADPNVYITAMGDIFEDRLEQALNSLSQIDGKRVKVDKKHRFIGFDAYQRVLEADVDVVLLATPPGFRPDHLAAAVKAGKHIFCEKPVAVDAPGVRKVLDAVRQAKEQRLCLVSGFCFRYDWANRAVFGKVLDGEIGSVNTVSTFRNGGELWSIPRQPDWSEMTYQLRNWYYYNWLSGDFIVEQAVHSLDMMSWAMGDKMPVKATGTGGRQVRTDEIYGNIYDHFAIEFEYENGAHGFHFTRQQAGTSNRNSVEVLGSDGRAVVNIGGPVELIGKNNWKYRDKKNNMYQTQHDELFAAIRKGTPINDGEWMANSTMLAIWGRMVAYSGQTITWEQAIQSEHRLGPAIEEYAWDLKWEGPGIAVPGKTKFV